MFIYLGFAGGVADPLRLWLFMAPSRFLFSTKNKLINYYHKNEEGCRLIVVNKRKSPKRWSGQTREC